MSPKRPAFRVALEGHTIEGLTLLEVARGRPIFVEHARLFHHNTVKFTDEIAY